MSGTTKGTEADCKPQADAERRGFLVRLYASLLDDDAGHGVSGMLRAALLDEPPEGPDLFRDLGAAQAFAFRVLPDFYVTSGLCYLSGHASLGPDYNGPAGERLFREWPVEKCDGGWHEDLHPDAGGIADVSHQCAAILRCVMKAVAFREGIEGIGD